MSWPGNVRELENVVRRALVSSRGIIKLSDIHEAIAQDTVARSVAPLPAGDQPLSGYVADLLARVMSGELEDAHARVIAAAELELYGQAIQLAEGEQGRAARWLGVSRPTMREKLVRYGLHPRRLPLAEAVLQSQTELHPLAGGKHPAVNPGIGRADLCRYALTSESIQKR
jgi:two-component system nitrogen regulation response regulator GlnG